MNYENYKYFKVVVKGKYARTLLVGTRYECEETVVQTAFDCGLLREEECKKATVKRVEYESEEYNQLEDDLDFLDCE